MYIYTTALCTVYHQHIRPIESVYIVVYAYPSLPLLLVLVLLRLSCEGQGLDEPPHCALSIWGKRGGV